MQLNGLRGWRGGDHKTTDQGYVWLFDSRSKYVGAGLAYGL